MRLRVADDGLCARCDEPLHVFVGIELGEKLFIPIRNVHVDDGTAPGVFVPEGIPDAVRFAEGGGRSDEAGGQGGQRGERRDAGRRAGEKIPTGHGRMAVAVTTFLRVHNRHSRLD